MNTPIKRLKWVDNVQETERRIEALKQLEGDPNKAKIREDEHFDSMYLIGSLDDYLSAEDVVMGYKQIFKVEQVFRKISI